MNTVELPHTIELTLTEEHLKGDYMSNTDCPIARAVKEFIGGGTPNVGRTIGIYIDQRPPLLGRPIAEYEYDEPPGLVAGTLIAPVTLTLTKIEP